jgi:RNA polymerase sigma factor (sigma-70 family)
MPPACPDAPPAAVEALLDQHRRLVYLLAYRLCRGRPHLDVEDLTQVGLVAAGRAIRRFDPARDVKLSSFIGLCAEQSMRAEAARNRPWRQLPVDGDGQEWDVPDHRPGVVADVQEREEQQHRRGLLAQLLGQLPARQREALARRYGLEGYAPHSLSELGRVLRTTPEGARQLCDRAVKAIRRNARQLGAGPSGLNEEGVEAAAAPSAWHSSSC